jgi:hypothetical protein
LDAEKAVTEVLKSRDARAITATRQDVMLAGRQAVDVLHHLADFVLKEPTPSLTFARIEDVPNVVETKCTSL